MKIAIPSRGTEVDNHFGHCEFFTVYTINNDNGIVSEELIRSPRGCGCKSDIASNLSNLGVKVMLAGNMGQGAVNVLEMSGINVVRGCNGNVKDVAIGWLSGVVKDSSTVCDAHDGCGGH